MRSKPQTLQGVGVCETPNPKRRGGAKLESEATKPLKRERRVWVPCETLNSKTAEWLRKIQTLKGVGECKTLNPKRSEWLRNPHTLKKEWVRAQPQTRKRSEWVRNACTKVEAEKFKGAGGCEKTKQTKLPNLSLLTAGHGHAPGPWTAERRHGPP